MVPPAHGKKVLDTGFVGLCADDLPGLGDSPESSRLDPRDWFDPATRDRPFEIEIGSGKGTFLVNEAAARPEVNFLGMEYAAEYWRYAADRLRRNARTNVRLLHYDASVFMSWYCPDGVAERVHVYFPDPWPKARHHKRRLIQAPFLQACHRVLRPEGELCIVTDHEGYWEWIDQRLSTAADLFECLAFERPGAAGEGEVVGTNFERKYRREGRPFHAVRARRK